MRLGLHALGIGNDANRAVIDAVASAADSAGFATLWSGEHVVMVDESVSRYPYSDDGRIAVPARPTGSTRDRVEFHRGRHLAIRIATGVCSARTQSGAGGQAGRDAGRAERGPANARRQYRLVA